MVHKSPVHIVKRSHKKSPRKSPRKSPKKAHRKSPRMSPRMSPKKSPSVGSRAMVWHGNAQKTSGGLTKSDLMKSYGRIVSIKKHRQGKHAYQKNCTQMASPYAAKRMCHAMKHSS